MVFYSISKSFLCFRSSLLKVWSITWELAKFRTSGSSQDLLNQNPHFNQMPGFTSAFYGQGPVQSSTSLSHWSLDFISYYLPFMCSLPTNITSLLFLKHNGLISTSGTLFYSFYWPNNSFLRYLHSYVLTQRSASSLSLCTLCKISQILLPLSCSFPTSPVIFSIALIIMQYSAYFIQLFGLLLVSPHWNESSVSTMCSFFCNLPPPPTRHTQANMYTRWYF